MFRTQIYLTDSEKEALNRLTADTAKTQSELIRQAIDEFIAKYQKEKRKKVLAQTAGLWANRTDLPDFDKLRKEWDRH